MPRHGGRHVVLVQGAEQAMHAFKLEIAADLGLDAKIGTGMSAYKNLTTAEAGQLGGTMVRRIQAMGELMIKQRYEAGEKRLLPPELLPSGEYVRDVSNNGNTQWDPALNGKGPEQSDLLKINSAVNGGHNNNNSGNNAVH